jgi:hypothetical protein
MLLPRTFVLPIYREAVIPMPDQASILTCSKGTAAAEQIDSFQNAGFPGAVAAEKIVPVRI